MDETTISVRDSSQFVPGMVVDIHDSARRSSRLRIIAVYPNALTVGPFRWYHDLWYRMSAPFRWRWFRVQIRLWEMDGYLSYKVERK
jgi:hypothetical protein